MDGMPRPNEHHQKLHRLAGTYVGEETLHPSPWSPGGSATGRNVGRVDLDGFFVIQDYQQERNGQVTFRGHGLFGWDDRARSYLWYWVDSMGEMPAAPARGQWTGDTLVFQQSQGDRHTRYTYVFADDESYRFKIESSNDGGRSFSAFMEATYRRA